jgi:very-short-patch-repair endonuclease
MSDGVRTLAYQIAEAVKDHNTHSTLADACSELGMTSQIDDDTGSKRDRVFARLTGKSPRDIAAIAEQVGARYGKFDLEEAALKVLEADDPPLTEITRRDVARCFDPPSLSGELGLLDLLRRIWPVDAMGDWFRLRRSLADAIHQYMVRNDDWSTEDLFEELGALSCSRKRFFRLLEAVMHPLARRGPEQEELRDRLNAVLVRDGYRIEEAGLESGYPIYRVTRIASGVSGRPKNLIFASNGPKPEIGLQDAINNDIIILSNADSCLVYDRPLPRTGLLWSQLVDWWCEQHRHGQVSEEEARRELGQRLRVSLTSDAERGLFDEYFRSFRKHFGNALPALVPQVYLHYDPAIVARLRHRSSLPRQRMDFLMLLPDDARVVIEVDGRHHFTRGGAPSLPAYAEMVKADRDLRLLGYEIYRFGANELVGPGASDLVRSFFARLFERHQLAA